MTAATATPEISVILPTFNGRRYLGVVLDALAHQTLPPTRFEVVVVDNNSTVDLFTGPGTPEVLAKFRDKGIAFKCVPELKQGLTYARIRGVKAASGPVVCFLDDDNEPVPEYLETGLKALADSTIGLLVSRVFPAYEVPPPPAVRRRQHLFAINFPYSSAPIRWSATEIICPTLGAGLWIRKNVFDSIQNRFAAGFLPDRIKDNLISGGDIELGIAAGKLGYDRVYVPELVIRHHIPKERLQSKYMIRLITGIVRSEAALHYKYQNRAIGFIKRMSRLIIATAFGWVPALVRGDVLREYRFIVANAMARYRGPIVQPDR
jgi:glycosyltransferase involved in cell wall biosynthesis